MKALTKPPLGPPMLAALATPLDHRREPPPRQAELLCPDLVPGVRRIKHPRGKEARAPL
jgi:hypothetical protein